IDPVVGWLVCIKGPDLGRDYRIRAERNFIGRSDEMDICIASDASISRERHAVVTYNPTKNSFRLAPGESRGMVCLNEEEVETPVPLSAYDRIQLGESELIFIPFCGESFKWEKAEAGQTED
ncbi:MAG TPA: FHA domain-containing protein, partial [Blastocatellia bacterium]|nr:FHA domain-containing protein [Blastocatellia bacterium]